MIIHAQSLTASIRRLDAGPMRYAGRVAIVPLIAASLVACGGGGDPKPTATLPSPTATTVDVTATSAATTTSGVITANASPVASPVAGTVTVGDLADRIAVAWSSVTSYRSTTTVSSLTNASTPGAVPAIVTVAEVQVPNRKHWINQSNGVTQYEFISVDGRIYGRGPAVADQNGGQRSGSWFVIDPSSADPESVFATLYAQLLTPVTAPYSSLGAQERSRDATPIEQRIIDGQSAPRIVSLTQQQRARGLRSSCHLGQTIFPARSKPPSVDSKQ